MSLNNFITDILNIDLNSIENIQSIQSNNQKVDIFIKLKCNKPKCKICNGDVKIHGYSTRKLIHSTLVNRECIIYYKQRRFKCDVCDYTFPEKNPFINTKEQVTYETKINVLKELKWSGATYTSVAKRYFLSITKVQRIFDAHVDIPRKPLPRVLSIDEHHFPKSSFDSLYCCLLMDFETGILIDVLPDRKEDYLKYYFNTIQHKTFNPLDHTSELDNVKYVSIDLYKPYKQISQLYFPKAKLCADSFHVLEHLTLCFRTIRLKCRRSNQDGNMIYLLTKFKFVFNHDIDLDNEGKYNKRFNRVLNFRDIFTLITNRFPELKEAYDLKEKYIRFNETSSVENASLQLTTLIDDFSKSGIHEYDEFYNLLINWNQEIVNSFYMVHEKRINNSFMESRNRQVETLIFNANGFINFKRARNRILYCLNKNDTFKL